MTKAHNFLFLVVIAIALLFVSCGGSKSSQGTSPAATTAANNAMSNSGGTVAAAAAPVPADLKCKGPVVWVNLTKGVYHTEGDQWYGRTKHGEYECEAAANAHGYHMAGSHATTTTSHHKH